MKISLLLAKLSLLGLTAALLMTIGFLPERSFAQATSGNLAGVVTDSTGAIVPNAEIIVTNVDTGIQSTTKTNSNGEYLVPNLLPGRYRLNVAGGGLKGEVAEILVRLNQTITANVTATAQGASTTVEVAADVAPIDTITPQIQTTFEAKQTEDLPEASTGSGVINLSLLNAGVASSGGIGVGTGPSISGQRPRNNNFMVEGVDNNAKSVTGPLVQVPNDAVQNFSVLQNQFNPEFGHSSGGQFNETIKGGTNSFHGVAYEYFKNRDLNAIDAGTARSEAGPNFFNPRFDNNRFGGAIGGPILKDKLFFYALDEYNPIGQSAQNSYCAPTAAGYATIQALGGNNINQTNLQQFQKYDGTAAAGAAAGSSCQGTNKNGTNNFLTTGGGVAGPYQIGQVNVSGPNFTNNFTTVNSVDYDLSQADQLRFRYIWFKQDSTDTADTLPTFFNPVPVRDHLFTFSEYHTFTPNLTNEFRLGFNRNSQNFIVGSQVFPNLGTFPNLVINDLKSQIGPDQNAPQFTIQNLYQATENIIWVKGKHNFKFGAEGRKSISPQGFTQRSRGDYEYNNFSTYLYDFLPTSIGQRSTGSNTYYGDQSSIYLYANDSYRMTPHLTIDAGLRWEFTSVPTGEREQTLNAIASVPGVLTFGAPQPQYTNFAPRVGFAFSPGNSGNTSIRGGFGMAYDVLFDNLGLLTVPPEFGGTCDVNNGVIPGCSFSGTASAPGFLAGGGLPAGQGSGLKTFATQAAAAALTAGYVPNQTLPYTETWDFGVQHTFGGKYVAEVRYVGTRGIKLPAQVQINKQSKVTSTQFLPTFLSQPSQATLDALTNTFNSINANSAIVPAYKAAGFVNSITSYEPFGRSVYHGLQTQLNRSFTHGLQFQAAWTWSHNEDDSTAEVFSTVLTPRRAQDSQNIGADFGTSALDRRHRVTMELIYDLPFFKNSNGFMKNVVGNWEIAPVYEFQTPEYFTAQSGVDSNLNGDTAPDRTIFNPAGAPGTGSTVTALCNSGYVTSGAQAAGISCGSSGKVNGVTVNTQQFQVAYLANNPNAQYIEAGQGALATAGRNTIPLPRINNWDLTAVKRVNVTERVAVEFRAEAYNVFNHSQYVAGRLNDVAPLGFTSAAATSFVQVIGSNFNQPNLTFNNNARTMQLVAKFTF